MGVQPHGDPGPDRDGRREVPEAGELPDAPGEGQYLQLVISASYDLLALDKLAIRDAVLAELAEIWPAAGSAKLLRWWVVTEHGATFAVRPGVEALRPPQRTPIDGLFLAGDWTDTGWPATMEGAVRSGYLAAQEILTDLDRPTRLIRPGLKSGAAGPLALRRGRVPARQVSCSTGAAGRDRAVDRPHPPPLPGPDRRPLIGSAANSAKFAGKLDAPRPRRPLYRIR